MQLKSRIKIFIISLIITLVFLRIYLFVSPSANLNIGKYNIHHLYIGAFLVIIILIFFMLNVINNLTIVLAGFSSALVLDELVYLIVTDGSDISYLTPVSLLGMIILTNFILILTIILYSFNKQNLRK